MQVDRSLLVEDCKALVSGIDQVTLNKRQRVMTWYTDGLMVTGNSRRIITVYGQLVPMNISLAKEHVKALITDLSDWDDYKLDAVVKKNQLYLVGESESYTLGYSEELFPRPNEDATKKTLGMVELPVRELLPTLVADDRCDPGFTDSVTLHLTGPESDAHCVIKTQIGGGEITNQFRVRRTDNAPVILTTNRRYLKQVVLATAGATLQLNYSGQYVWVEDQVPRGSKRTTLIAAQLKRLPVPV
jgi:hypothetical protein